ncbi:hypothetical protein BRADI_2g04733v3 [Brachypodium distachyon]|uniref:Uncharacterized protein n=1 Tax=Brachypodium distachyon TaxID=15368 RepID=A0A0Q3FUA5_BRADI|nr:hypothetical protein BRADI_2g04733v3 [Brachypodium distachyon]
MGAMSRRVLPSCRALCYFCPTFGPYPFNPLRGTRRSSPRSTSCHRYCQSCPLAFENGCFCSNVWEFANWETLPLCLKKSNI